MMEIFITTEFVGLHKWDNAPEKVSFLRNLHRHIFKVKVWFKVNHNNRDLEFFLMKEKIENRLEQTLKAINYENIGSCETLCENISTFDNKITKVEVSEDGENGAILTL
jgi:hypothetical protein